MNGRGMAGYTPTALASATGKWSSWAGDPNGVWQPFTPGSTEYNSAVAQLTSICGGAGAPSPGMTTVGYNNQCNPPLAPYAGETGAQWTAAEQAYTKGQMTSTQANQYQANLNMVAAAQGLTVADTTPAPSIMPATGSVTSSVVNSPNLSQTIGGQQPTGVNLLNSMGPIPGGSTPNMLVSGVGPFGLSWVTILLLGGAAAIGIYLMTRS